MLTASFLFSIISLLFVNGVPIALLDKDERK